MFTEAYKHSTDQGYLQYGWDPRYFFLLYVMHLLGTGDGPAEMMPLFLDFGRVIYIIRKTVEGETVFYQTLCVFVFSGEDLTLLSGDDCPFVSLWKHGISEPMYTAPYKLLEYMRALANFVFYHKDVPLRILMDEVTRFVYVSNKARDCTRGDLFRKSHILDNCYVIGEILMGFVNEAIDFQIRDANEMGVPSYSTIYIQFHYANPNFIASVNSSTIPLFSLSFLLVRSFLIEFFQILSNGKVCLRLLTEEIEQWVEHCVGKSESDAKKKRPRFLGV